jgi:hypothetical protein
VGILKALNNKAKVSLAEAFIHVKKIKAKKARFTNISIKS